MVKGGADISRLVVMIFIYETIADIMLALLIFFYQHSTYTGQFTPQFYVVCVGANFVEIDTEIKIFFFHCRSSSNRGQVCSWPLLIVEIKFAIRFRKFRSSVINFLVLRIILLTELYLLIPYCFPIWFRLSPLKRRVK